MIAQHLRVVDLVFQLYNVRSQFLDLGLDLFQAGAHLGAALALLPCRSPAFGTVLRLLLRFLYLLALCRPPRFCSAAKF